MRARLEQAQRKRRRKAALGEQQAGPPGEVGFWSIDARVADAELDQALEEILRLGLAVDIDATPPAAGPESEIHYKVLASSREHAERMGARLITRGGASVLAIRARR